MNEIRPLDFGKRHTQIVMLVLKAALSPDHSESPENPPRIPSNKKLEKHRRNRNRRIAAVRLGILALMSLSGCCREAGRMNAIRPFSFQKNLNYYASARTGRNCKGRKHRCNSADGDGQFRLLRPRRLKRQR